MRSLDASLPPISPHIEAKYTAEPVWRFIDDCIGMSFAVEMREMGTKSPTGIIIDDLMEQRYGLAPTITSDRRINKGRLKPIEFRAQCASVRRVIEQPDNKAGISPVQRSSILARFAYQVKRSAGVKGLNDHFACFCTTSNPSAIRALIWGHYETSSRQKTAKAILEARGDWSIGSLEKQYGVPKRTLQEDRVMLKKLIFNTEKQALLVLEDYFTRAGLIGEFE